MTWRRGRLRAIEVVHDLLDHPAITQDREDF